MEYDYKIVTRPAKALGNADGLNRLPRRTDSDILDKENKPMCLCLMVDFMVVGKEDGVKNGYIVARLPQDYHENVRYASLIQENMNVEKGVVRNCCGLFTLVKGQLLRRNDYGNSKICV